MPTNLEDWAKPSDRNEIAGTDSSMNMSSASAKMPSYIGTKVVCAVPMDELSFLREIKKQETSDRENMQGYLVIYEDGYKSWSPKETFERAYRLITDAERRLI